jgi:Flp pilus assembly protein TadD
VRLIFAKLAAGGAIPEHTDAGYSLLNCHRVHIPIVTNDQVVFSVGGERMVMHAGEFWEINNGGPHAVVNQGEDDQIHLIVDWMPNPEGRSVEAVLVPAQNVEGEPASHADSLNLIVVAAYQTQQAGNIHKARSLYKLVLDRDPGHIEANNLLGLLSLRTGNPNDAINYITRALAENPDDAQARANLGLALKDVGRFDDAAEQNRSATLLQPENPRTHNNLGNVLCELRRFADAVESYRRAVQLDPEFAEAHRNLGAALLHTNRIEEGVASLRRALAIRPDFHQARHELEQAMHSVRGRRPI